MRGPQNISVAHQPCLQGFCCRSHTSPAEHVNSASGAQPAVDKPSRASCSSPSLSPPPPAVTSREGETMQPGTAAAWRLRNLALNLQDRPGSLQGRTAHDPTQPAAAEQRRPAGAFARAPAASPSPPRGEAWLPEAQPAARPAPGLGPHTAPAPSAPPGPWALTSGALDWDSGRMSPSWRLAGEGEPPFPTHSVWGEAG